jgi:hyaluronan synthase
MLANSRQMARDAIAWGTNASTMRAWIRITLLVFVPTVALILVHVQRLPLTSVVSAYGVVAVGRIFALVAMAAAVRRRRPRSDRSPMVSIVVATLLKAEDLPRFAPAMRSLANQRYPRFEVIVVDDGSEPAAAEGIETVCASLGLRHIRQANAGKRRAMARAFADLHPDSEFVLTCDDDTIWDPDTASELVAALQTGPKIGAATGYMTTSNPHESWLTRLVTARYWFAFEVERAAQAWRGVVACVPGPLGCYRRDLIDRVRDMFVSQTFLGRECTFGDDRHLTNLILGLGYQVTYSRALAWTATPADLPTYLRQQLRWGKSFWRETIWTAKALPRHSVLLAANWTLELVMPFLLTSSLVWYLGLAAAAGGNHLLHFAAIMVGMALLRAALGTLATRDWSFLWLFPLYSILHLGLLLPLKFVSLATVARGQWGTRAPAPPTPDRPAGEPASVGAAGA